MHIMYGPDDSWDQLPADVSRLCSPNTAPDGDSAPRLHHTRHLPRRPLPVVGIITIFFFVSTRLWPENVK